MKSSFPDQVYNTLVVKKIIHKKLFFNIPDETGGYQKKALPVS
jgi:hypothetical protein